MKKTAVFISLLLILFLSACAALNLSSNPKVIPSDYETLTVNKEIKKINYKCSFDASKYEYPNCSFVEKCDNENPCFKVSDLDYVSFYMSFNFQNITLLANDYIMNLARSFEKDNDNIKRGYISELFNPVKRSFYDEDTKNLLFQKMRFSNMTAASFATKYNNDISIFLSKKDVFLRNTVYPSLKLTGIKKSGSSSRYLSDMLLQYTVYPHAFDVAYSTDWMAAYLGAPSLNEYENSVPLIQVYFRNLSANKDKIEEHSGSKLLDSEKARAFVFEDKIREAVKNNSTDAVMPLLPSKMDGFLNEYLPKYNLEKIEIVKKLGDTEKILKKFDKSSIAELLISNEEIAGFAYKAENSADGVLSIRFTHKADAPRYANPGLLKLRNSGIEGIYNKLRAVIVTDLDIDKPYELSSIPYDCVNKANISDILLKAGMSESEKDKYISIFKDKSTKCIPYEEFIIKVIFSRDFRN